MTASLHIVQIGFHLDPKGRGPEEILHDWWPLVDAAEMVAQAGVRVSVVQACRRSDAVTRNGVSYHFLAPPPGDGSMSRSPQFAPLMRQLQADVHHVHGLCFPRDVLQLALLHPDVPILLQDHAQRLPRFWRRQAYRRGFEAAAGVAFCALDQATPFVQARLLPPEVPIYAIPECSSRFVPAEREQARQDTGLSGDPAILWVGNLDDNKDPFTVLDGVSAATASLPGLQLWCCFRSGPLLPQVRARIDADATLRGRVHLLGNTEHARVRRLMQAADMLVLGSHREGSGCSVIEALACGLPTAVTSIPSFAALTAHGATGALWPCGDATRLADSLCAIAARPRVALRAAVRAHFERELSFEAVGSKLVAAYVDLRQRRRKRRARPASALT
jgi:glycosyltransferase involved in cell wall biosynthesis